MGDFAKKLGPKHLITSAFGTGFKGELSDTTKISTTCFFDSVSKQKHIEGTFMVPYGGITVENPIFYSLWCECSSVQ